MENKNLLTQKIIECAIEVNKHLGPGLLESAYEEYLCFELRNEGLNFERQKAVPIVYKEIKLECGYRLDVLVENEIVIEIKSVDAISPLHQAQVLTYLRFANKKLGLLLNFNVRILKDGIKRFVL